MHDNDDIIRGAVREGGVVERRVAQGDSISYSVVEAVAAATNTAMEDLPALYRSIDPDALDELVAPRTEGSARSRITVEFEYQDTHVTVDGETIEIRPLWK